MQLSATSTLGPVVGPVFRLRLKCGFIRRTYMRFIETVTVSVVLLTAVDFIQECPIPLSLFGLAVFSVLLLIVSFFELHGTNITNCWGGGT